MKEADRSTQPSCCVIHTQIRPHFKPDAKDVSAKISQKNAGLRADEWAAGFYGDALLQFVACQFKTKPFGIGWLRFRKMGLVQRYYALILPDKRVVMPDCGARTVNIL
jgi:hypothetical protein